MDLRGDALQTRNAEAYPEALISPGTIAVAVGMLIFLFSLDIPGPLAQAVELVGAYCSLIHVGDRRFWWK